MYVAQEHSIYGSSRVGVDGRKDTLYKAGNYSPSWGGVGTSRRELGLKSFELANHLGNVLVTVSDKPVYKVSSGTIYFQPEVSSISDYYPFGAPITGRSFSNTEYRFGFNGKENDRESETQDYGMRINDCRLGRFLSVDPLAKEYAWNSSYTFAENDIVRCIDLEGGEKLNVVTSSFAPYNTFGSDLFGSYKGDGENRQFGMQLDKYRMSGGVLLDLATTTYIGKWSGLTTSQYMRKSHILFEDYSSISESNTNIDLMFRSDDFIAGLFQVNGGNSAAAVSADIDNHVFFAFDRINEFEYHIFGSVVGDRFPANETYILDENKNMLILGVSGPNNANKDLAPYQELLGNNTRPMSTFDFNILFENDKKTIKGVKMNNGKFFNRQNWNKKFQNMDPKNPQTGTSIE
jgi:RHS repeat-associated protein